MSVWNWNAYIIRVRLSDHRFDDLLLPPFRTQSLATPQPTRHTAQKEALEAENRQLRLELLDALQSLTAGPVDDGGGGGGPGLAAMGGGGGGGGYGGPFPPPTGPYPPP